MTDTETLSSRRRRSSISEYSQIFSQAGPKPSAFINQPRHPSLSMRHDRSSSINKLGVNVAGLTAAVNENAIDDSDIVATSPNMGSGPMTGIQQRSKADDPVAIGRRLSMGARAIMFNGNRLRGDSLASGERMTLARSVSSGSGSANSPRSPQLEFDEKKFSVDEHMFGDRPVLAAKQIKRRMSPTGERMLRGELAFH